MAKPIRVLELHYPMIQFLIILISLWMQSNMVLITIQIKPLWQNFCMLQLNLQSQPPLHNYGHPSATATFFVPEDSPNNRSRPSEKGGGRGGGLKKYFFLAFWAPVWSNNNGLGPSPGSTAESIHVLTDRLFLLNTPTMTTSLQQ